MLRLTQLTLARSAQAPVKKAEETNARANHAATIFPHYPAQ